jgi:hypothetical protein
VREKSTDAAPASQTQEVVKRKPYSPFRTNSTVEFAVARVDDLLNWCRKVSKLYNKR